MRKKSAKSIVFDDILADLEESNSRRVQARAVLANRIAKIATSGVSRQRAYARKAAALLHGIEVFPREYHVGRVEADGTLALDYRDRPALHLPASAFHSARMRRWLDRERGRLADRQPAGRSLLELAA